MALTEESAAKVVNALQSSASSLIQECLDWATKPGGGTGYYGYTGPIEWISGLFQGLVWVACGQRNRGVGVFERAIPTPEAVNASMQNLVGFDQYSGSPNDWTESVNQLRTELALFRSGQPSNAAEVAVQFAERLGTRTKAYTQDLLRAFAAVRYDVEEVLKSVPAAATTQTPEVAPPPAATKPAQVAQTEPSGLIFCDVCGVNIALAQGEKVYRCPSCHSIVCPAHYNQSILLCSSCCKAQTDEAEAAAVRTASTRQFEEMVIPAMLAKDWRQVMEHVRRRLAEVLPLGMQAVDEMLQAAVIGKIATDRLIELKPAEGRSLLKALDDMERGWWLDSDRAIIDNLYREHANRMASFLLEAGSEELSNYFRVEGEQRRPVDIVKENSNQRLDFARIETGQRNRLIGEWTAMFEQAGGKLGRAGIRPSPWPVWSKASRVHARLDDIFGHCAALVQISESLFQFRKDIEAGEVPNLNHHTVEVIEEVIRNAHRVGTAAALHSKSAELKNEFQRLVVEAEEKVQELRHLVR